MYDTNRDKAFVLYRSLCFIISLFQNLNKDYLAKLEEVGELQGKCVKEIDHQRYRIGIISQSLKK